MKEFPVLLININSSTRHYSFVLTELNCYKYCCIHIFWINTDTMINDASRKEAGRKTHEGRHRKTSLEKYSPLTLLQGFERVV